VPLMEFCSEGEVGRVDCAGVTVSWLPGIPTSARSYRHTSHYFFKFVDVWRIDSVLPFLQIFLATLYLITSSSITCIVRCIC